MKFKSILTAFAAVLALAACKPALNIADPLINTGAVSYELPAEGGSVDVTFRSNLPWHIVLSPANAKSDIGGITVKPNSGEGSIRDITVTVKCTTNPGDERQVLMAIIGEGAAIEAAVRLIQPKISTPGGDDTPAYGTLSNPYPANQLHKDMLDGNIPTGDIYIRGIVSKVKEISTEHGNATFWITDDGTHPDSDIQAFQVYRAKDTGLADITNPERLKVGDVVTIYGPVVIFPATAGPTPETDQNKASIFAVNGVGSPTGDGSAENPYNVGAAMSIIDNLEENASSPEVHVKGVFSKYVEFYAPNGNYTYYISDDGYQPSPDAAVLQIFRSKYFEGGNYTDQEQLHMGDEIVVRGTLKNYNGEMPEMNTGGILVSLNGKTSE